MAKYIRKRQSSKFKDEDVCLGCVFSEHKCTKPEELPCCFTNNKDDVRFYIFIEKPESNG